MLRSRVRLSVLTSVRASLVAPIIVALLGSMILAVLPTTSGPDPRPAVELTSGGKFAARIPGVAQDSAPSAAESRTATPSAGALLARLDVGPMPLTGPDGGAAVIPSEAVPVPSSADRPARRAHPARQALVRRPVETAPQPPARPAALPVADPAAEEGMLARTVSSVRSLWSFSATTGAALVSRLVP